ncbi:DUF3097 domain-containing protein [Corynebacterium suicordis]|uniref:DUF3097 domain-containing protein n=1 Tax=Corynebacterium suicordis DSM 45110 TaxID=1121369 RepID=A0ABR9ZKY0_9CORY|nr:DUF3097 domain-containing protein [Corynebacterium suicordis]MBF4553613.1 DUF3097 domain-containing protein [Corynebacterium suicordis DSM 45110]MDR6277413.1 hypothetical protein [Corynebacterium suicordis]
MTPRDFSSRDPYSADILQGHSRRQPVSFPEVRPELDMVVEVFGDEFVGGIIGGERTADGDFIRLEDRYGASRLFKLRPGGFLLEGKRITLTRYVDPRLIPSQPTRSNSGSRRVEGVQAKVAAPSRIWVEGVHDAAIVEKVWGHDLRVEGVVVEFLEGLDNLEERLREFQPTAERRVGVLADHLIAGTKEARMTQNLGPHVMVTGHPYVDIWEAVKPSSVKIPAWPQVLRGEDWKTGVCDRLGWGSPQDGWRRVYRSVNSFRDLDSTLIGAVERLIDFVTVPQE